MVLGDVWRFSRLSWSNFDNRLKVRRAFSVLYSSDTRMSSFDFYLSFQLNEAHRHKILNGNESNVKPQRDFRFYHKQLYVLYFFKYSLIITARHIIIKNNIS